SATGTSPVASDSSAGMSAGSCSRTMGSPSAKPPGASSVPAERVLLLGPVLQAVAPIAGIAGFVCVGDDSDGLAVDVIDDVDAEGPLLCASRAPALHPSTARAPSRRDRRGCRRARPRRD